MTEWEKEFDERFLTYGEFSCENGQSCEVRPTDVKAFISSLLETRDKELAKRIIDDLETTTAFAGRGIGEYLTEKYL
jgi:hypothetical protein